MDLINSLNIDLELDVHENEARSTSQSLCDGQVLPALDRVLRRFEDEDIIIEQPLIIELGDVPEGQLSHAVEDAFYRALAKRRREAVTPYEAARLQDKKPLSEVFLDYLQYPVLPWDTDDVKQFDEQGVMLETAQRALSSDEYLKRLTALVEGDVKACIRFFDLPWAKKEMVPVLQRMLAEIPTLQGQVYSRLLRLIGDDREDESSLTREVFSYILSGVLFGNRRDADNCEAIATLLVVAKEGRNASQVQPKAIQNVMSGFKPVTNAHAGRQLSSSQKEVPYYATMGEPAAKLKERREVSSTVETNDAVVERREVLKQGLAHDEGMRDRLLRLIHLVGLVLKGEASFSHCIVEMEALVESLWKVVPLKMEKVGSLFSGYSQTFSGGPAEAVETTTIVTSKRQNGSPSSEEIPAETVTAMALERPGDSMPFEETSATAATTDATRHLDGTPTLVGALPETTTDMALGREEGTPSLEEESFGFPIASSSRRQDGASSSKKSHLETTTAATLSSPDGVASLEGATAKTTTAKKTSRLDEDSLSEEDRAKTTIAATLNRLDGPPTSLDTNLETTIVSTRERPAGAPLSKETSPETAAAATLRRIESILSAKKASDEMTTLTTSRQSDGTSLSEGTSVENADVFSTRRQDVSSSSKESLAEAAATTSMGHSDVSSSLKETIIEVAAVATQSWQESASSKEKALPEVANAVKPIGQERMPSEMETSTGPASVATSKPLSSIPLSEKTTVEKATASTMRHLDSSPSSEKTSNEKAVVTPAKWSNGSESVESFAETTYAAMGTESVSLSEEDVVDVIAFLSARHEAESKWGVSQVDTARLQEVVAAAIRKQPDIEKRIPVHNAGLVLFQPFLISFFDRMGLLESRKSFKSLESQLRAAHLLHELSGFGGEHLEHLLPLNKLLCGINIMFPIGTTFEAMDEEKREVDGLLKATIRNWSAIGNVSPAGFQEAFVKREGLLERSQDEWILRVESKGIDVLLDYIPWDVHVLTFPWNDYLIYVDWKL